jgi:hypothetical protein
MLYMEILRQWDTGYLNSASPSRRVLPPGIYSSRSNRILDSASAAQQAERIWEETDEGVKYIKDRTAWDRSPDLKEFAWIKLRAQPLENIS